ncbi:hypothetical protein C7H19_18445 [Aphanothece hegewaldii CCALA 016]|uniref:Uncharacterized protein n=1 Tax=Aphanothece hegewaldii CCALA 016 TaxID=2107694 RepID=A0A2T1LTV2_9CHRO|nr:hypothetical protein [Aphanothece hegewaldii]PSF34547.1 hypothetical protein C7H19_18445 [Aphanothece hegewaldii CCALA 016]
MKKTQIYNSEGDELLSEYDFDYSKAKPNRFANQTKPNSLVITLDPDLAEVFKTSEAVNHALRSLLSAIPK